MYNYEADDDIDLYQLRIESTERFYEGLLNQVIWYSDFLYSTFEDIYENLLQSYQNDCSTTLSIKTWPKDDFLFYQNDPEKLSVVLSSLALEQERQFHGLVLVQDELKTRRRNHPSKNYIKKELKLRHCLASFLTVNLVSQWLAGLDRYLERYPLYSSIGQNLNSLVKIEEIEEGWGSTELYNVLKQVADLPLIRDFSKSNLKHFLQLAFYVSMFRTYYQYDEVLQEYHIKLKQYLTTDPNLGDWKEYFAELAESQKMVNTENVNLGFKHKIGFFDRVKIKFAQIK